MNEALNYLIDEHHYIDELESKLTDSSLTYQNISNHILENNLFGVDINSESVEIVKLSLWYAPPNLTANYPISTKTSNAVTLLSMMIQWQATKPLIGKKNFPKSLKKVGLMW